jgi:hypothetical protein
LFSELRFLYPLKAVRSAGVDAEEIELTDHVTLVASPRGTSVNSAVLWPSKGLMKSSLMATLAGGATSMIFMRPWPTLLLPSHS